MRLNNKIANMNYNKLLPAKDVTTHLREVITPGKGNVQKNNTPANGNANIYIQNYDFKIYSQHYPIVRN